MKNTSKLYLFFTSLFFLFSPFSFGIVIIYFEDSLLSEEISGLIVNLGLIFVLAITVGIFVIKNELKIPTKKEIKYLIFGLLSNIVIYFYVFQNPLNIEDFMTIYFTMILILLLYLLIIDNKKLNYELWIIAVLFFIVDYIHFKYIGSHYSHNNTDVEVNFIQRVFYLTIPITTLSLFIIKIRKYKIIDTFTIIFISITALIGLVFTNGIDVENKYILTLNLLVPFVIITDFIVSKIYKRFNSFKLTFYIRMSTIILLIYIYDGIRYFTMASYSDHNLCELVMITYVIIICNLIEYLIPKN